MSKRKVKEEEAGTSRSKKFRADNDSIGTMERSAFEDLPEEMKDEIFRYLPCKDILKMALMSKSFNFFIGTSSIIMNRFEITLDMDDLRRHKKENERDEVSVGERNYSNLTIKKVSVCDIPLASELLTKFGLSVKKIHFRVNVHMIVLESLLKICKNVEVIESNSHHEFLIEKLDPKILSLFKIANQISSPSEIEQSRLAVEARLKLNPAPLDLVKLKDFECCCVPTFALVGNCQLKKLTFKSCNYMPTHYDLFELKTFLEKQSSLEFMKLGFGSRTLLFSDDFMSKMSFKLKSLDLMNLTLDLDSKETHNFGAFVKLHEHSLERLQCEYISMIQYFADIKTLSTLELSGILYNNAWNDDCSVMPHIKNLSMIGFTSIDNISIKFPNLKELTAIGNFFERFKAIEKSLSLEKLTLQYDCGSQSPPALNMPNLKCLHLIRCSFQVKPFEFDGNQLKELIFESNGGGEHWLIDYLNLESTNLKLLKFANMDLGTSFQLAIEANRHKIKNVVFKNVKFLG